MIEHGGRVLQAARRYGIAPAQWLDVSTGINPRGWSPPPMPPGVWAALPQDDDELIEAARDYYGVESLLPVAGSQAAIQTLPRLRAPARVGIIAPTYAEHASAWRANGHEVRLLSSSQVERASEEVDVLVLTHPNNPTGECLRRETLLRWHARLAARGGWLVIDEAFIDVDPDESMAPPTPGQGLIVLRSLGKFFGLPGARVGFVLAPPGLLKALAAWLGPWTIATPSRWIATQALRDRDWQSAMRRELTDAGLRLRSLLNACGLAPGGGCASFQWVPTTHAAHLHEALAQRGVLTRLFDEPSSLRFGLPGTAPEWDRLREALEGVMAEIAA